MENRTRAISDPPVRRSVGRLFLDTISEGILNVAFFLLQFVGWGIRWTIATVFFLGVMAAAGYYVFMQALSGGQHVQVPSIVGMDLAAASSLITQQGLELGKPIQVAHDSVPRNFVLAQRPAADRVVRTGRKVYPTISAGSEYLAAPNLLMKDWTTAQQEILAAQFQPHVARIPHKSPRDTVIAQDPPPGATIANQGTINLLLSGGDESSITFMPNIIGLTEEELTQALAGYDVKLEPVVVEREDVPVNEVLSQQPAENEYLYPGSTVRYEIKREKEEEEKPLETYTASVEYTAPVDGAMHTVVVKATDRNGRLVKVEHPPGSGNRTETPSWDMIGGSKLTYPITYTEQAKIEVTDNGQLVATWYLKEGGAPQLYRQ